VAYALRNSSAKLGTSNRQSERRSARPLSKRGVVAFRKRSLRTVESGQTPKDVLSGTFKNLRRTASTISSKRMSLRFARTPQEDRASGSQVGAVSEDWNWRPVGDVVSDVMRNVIVAAALAKAQ
jgi:hypothetical protein